ncbi:MAG TPA: hypothetical protein VLM36_08890 [Sphingomicrobium sp.]|nr:hypothetical protein [Sphingomicrobium sp.]
MDSGQLTAVMIVAIVMLASIIRAVVRGPRHPAVLTNQQGESENRRLRDEVSQLKERIKVLERITVEKENSLSREIESLRDR